MLSSTPSLGYFLTGLEDSSAYQMGNLLNFLTEACVEIGTDYFMEG